MIQINIFCPKCSAKIYYVLSGNDHLKMTCSSCGADCGESTPVAGFLYALKNESMPGLLKIGFTTRSIEERVAELGASTATPTPFEIVFYFACNDPQSDEVLAHEVLAKYRINQDREFFKINDGEALRILRAKLCRQEIFVSTGIGRTSNWTDDSLMNKVQNLRKTWKTTAGSVKAISLIYRLISASKYSEAKKVLELFLIDNPDHSVARKQLLQVKHAIKKQLRRT